MAGLLAGCTNGGVTRGLLLDPQFPASSFRFPRAYLVKAFSLAIEGLHYEIVMNGIVREARTPVRRLTHGGSPASHHRREPA